MKNNQCELEQLSAIMDDEQGIENMKPDSEMTQTWARYHLIGAAMRQELASHIDTDLSERIAQYIETHPAPVNNQKDKKKTIIPFKNWLKKKKAYTSLFAQSTIAASVALFIVHLAHIPSAPSDPIHSQHTKPFLGQISPVGLQSQPIEHDLSETQSATYRDIKLREQLLLQEEMQDELQQPKPYPANSKTPK